MVIQFITVLGGDDALEQDRQAGYGLEPLHVLQPQFRTHTHTASTTRHLIASKATTSRPSRHYRRYRPFKVAVGCSQVLMHAIQRAVRLRVHGAGAGRR